MGLIKINDIGGGGRGRGMLCKDGAPPLMARAEEKGHLFMGKEEEEVILFYQRKRGRGIPGN